MRKQIAPWKAFKLWLLAIWNDDAEVAISRTPLQEHQRSSGTRIFISLSASLDTQGEWIGVLVLSMQEFTVQVVSNEDSCSDALSAIFLLLPRFLFSSCWYLRAAVICPSSASTRSSCVVCIISHLTIAFIYFVPGTRYVFRSWLFYWSAFLFCSRTRHDDIWFAYLGADNYGMGKQKTKHVFPLCGVTHKGLASVA